MESRSHRSAVGGLIALLLAWGPVVGCGPSGGGSVVSPEEAFVAAVRADAPRLADGLSDAEVLTVGYAVCDRSGSDGQADLSVFGDIGPNEVAAVTRAAGRHLCPAP